MNENPTLKLKIEGHTDNAGDDDANMTLSENRAAAVKAYLVSKGISEDRITIGAHTGARAVHAAARMADDVNAPRVDGGEHSRCLIFR